MRVLARELGHRGITVNTLSPGFTDTDLLPERDRAVAAGMSPFQRSGAPADVADVAGCSERGTDHDGVRPGRSRRPGNGSGSCYWAILPYRVFEVFLILEGGPECVSGGGYSCSRWWLR